MRNSMKRWALIILAMSVFLVACGSDDTSAQSEGPIKIGFAMGFTSWANAFDGPVFNGAKLAIEDINAAGGINGRLLEILEADTQSDLTKVEAAALTVLDQGAHIVVTTCDYDYGAPAARAANKQGVLAIGCAGDPLYGKEGIGPLSFNVLATTPNEAGVMSSFAQRKGWTNAYLFADTSIQYSLRGCDYIEESFTATGIGVAGKDTFQNSDTSVAPQVSRMKSTDADFIVLCSYVPGVTAAIRQIRAAGIDLPILGMLGVDGRLVSTGTENLSDLYYLNLGSIRPDSTSLFLIELGVRYEEMVGNFETSDYGPILGYTEIQAVALAIEATGSTDGATLAAYMETFQNVPTAVGPLTYSTQCHAPINGRMFVAEVQNGTVKFNADPMTPINVPEASC
jgi:branched-chain amino acid transport system substrate-binding protein